ncbi:hypothetical protein POM88_031193 [Heracleum sosnowskyi]|uniref:Uncharacterized protein n=1 Tax=Heracleum sosnowskyi TaxID=360622 RepID=A0AAD8MGE6_9APIA|nr:hypothetical protein POM88_031193 [Heracleum sosnowskyi]
MHRQSLGSPNSKLHSNGVLIAANDSIELLTTDDFNLKQQLASQLVTGDDEQLRKSQKPHKSPEKLIHIIPILIVFCFLILYLTSHDPSQKGVDNLKGLNRNSKAIEIPREIDDMGGGVSATGILAIRNSRNLQEESFNKKQTLETRLNRKLGHF